MAIVALKSLFERDLEKLKKEISSYKNEENIWKVKKHILNSGGNLTLHIIGNLNHFVGGILGNSGYVRDRDAEFAKKDVTVVEMKRQIDELKAVIYNTLASLSDEDIDKIFPLQVFGYEMTTRYFLIHLLAHLNYHLGQINYHRRLLDN